MKRTFLAAVLALAVAALGANCGGGGGPKGELGDTRGGGATGGDQGGATGETGDRGAVTGSDLNKLKTIYFDFDKYNLRDDARAALNENAKILQDNPDMNIVIQGNCDERGTDEYNLALGERRARAAMEYLTKLGIDTGRISIISYGEERPVAPGHDEESWSLNRRGDFQPK